MKKILDINNNNNLGVYWVPIIDAGIKIGKNLINERANELDVYIKSTNR